MNDTLRRLWPLFFAVTLVSEGAVLARLLLAPAPPAGRQDDWDARHLATLQRDEAEILAEVEAEAAYRPGPDEILRWDWDIDFAFTGPLGDEADREWFDRWVMGKPLPWHYRAIERASREGHWWQPPGRPSRWILDRGSLRSTMRTDWGNPAGVRVAKARLWELLRGNRLPWPQRPVACRRYGKTCRDRAEELRASIDRYRPVLLAVDLSLRGRP